MLVLPTLNHGLVAWASFDCEGPMPHILLDNSLAEVAANETLSIKHRVLWVHGHLVVGSITNETLCVCESHIAGGCAVALIIRDDLHAVILPDTHTPACSVHVEFM